VPSTFLFPAAHASEELPYNRREVELLEIVGRNYVI
jgi:hypothetical protein